MTGTTAFSLFLMWLCFNSSTVNSVCNSKECCNDSDYYWKEYRGTIPSDAIPGATDRNGDVTYIGQVLHPKQPSIIPGEIRKREKLMYYQHFGAHNTTKNVKILCSRHPEFYEWVPTDIGRINEWERRRTLVVGGFEDEEDIFIGRADDDGEKVIGKINSHFKIPQSRALYVAHRDRELQFSAFEVLTYNPGVLMNNDDDRIFNAFTINIYN